MEYTYYPGCSLESAAKPYDESMKAVFDILGIGLNTIPDWNCCGATAYMSVKETLSFSISARNLALAEKLKNDVIAPCSACYLILNKTNRLLQKNSVLRKNVNESLESAGLAYNMTLRIRHPLEVLINDVGIERIKEKAVKDLSGFKVANYYGCQLVRQYDRVMDDLENPMMMDNLFNELGAESVYFPGKVKCCGGMIMTTFEEVALKLNKDLLQTAVDNSANVIVTTCPMCQINLEAYQKKINREFDTNFNIPVIYFTQLLGLALGGKKKELGLHRILIPLDEPAVYEIGV